MQFELTWKPRAFFSSSRSWGGGGSKAKSSSLGGCSSAGVEYLTWGASEVGAAKKGAAFAHISVTGVEQRHSEESKGHTVPQEMDQDY